jgi:hypothetical protein
MPIVSVNIASPSPPRVQARRFHSSISVATATIDFPRIRSHSCCRGGNSGFFQPWVHEVTAPYFSALWRRQLENGQIDVGSSGCTVGQISRRNR